MARNFIGNIKGKDGKTPVFMVDDNNDLKVDYTEEAPTASAILSIVVDALYEVGGQPYMTFREDDDPNNKFPNTTWELLEENTYLVSAGDNINGDNVGSNSITLTTSNLPSHNHSGSISSISLTANSGGNHIHNPNQGERFITRSSGGSYGGLNPSSGSDYTYNTTLQTTSDGAHTHTINDHGHTLTINNNGSGESFDNRPNSKPIYIWRRLS